MIKKILGHLKENWIRHGFETLAVLIGVLAAFTLNNWNENRKKAERELVLLQNLRSDLEYNLSEHKRDLANVRLSYSNSLEVLKSVGKPESSEMLVDHFSNINRFTPFIPHLTAYESAKSDGLDILISDSLWHQITNYYEAVVRRLLLWQTSPELNPSLLLKGYLESHFQVDVSYNIDSLQRLDMNDPDIAVSLNLFYDGGSQRTMKPIDTPFVLSDPEFEFVLEGAVQRAAQLNRMHVGAINRLENILAQIDREIDGL